MNKVIITKKCQTWGVGQRIHSFHLRNSALVTRTVLTYRQFVRSTTYCLSQKQFLISYGSFLYMKWVTTSWTYITLYIYKKASPKQYKNEQYLKAVFRIRPYKNHPKNLKTITFFGRISFSMIRIRSCIKMKWICNTASSIHNETVCDVMIWYTGRTLFLLSHNIKYIYISVINCLLTLAQFCDNWPQARPATRWKDPPLSWRRATATCSAGGSGFPRLFGLSKSGLKRPAILRTDALLNLISKEMQFWRG